MIIELGVSEEKNLTILDELTNDPAFLVSLLKNMGYEKCPDCISIIGILKKKKDKNDKN